MDRDVQENGLVSTQEKTNTSIRTRVPAQALTRLPSQLTSPKWKSVCSTLTWMPKRCRYDPARPPPFTLRLNLLFAFAVTFTIANQYYNHPILNKLAEDFDVSYERVSAIPALMQAGYAVGLFFLCPLGNLRRTRPFVLLLVLVTATLWIGLCLTTSFATFCILSFFSSATSVTPQIMVPLVGGLAPIHCRATALSITVSGLLLGGLLSRVLSGVFTQYAGWRNVYWLSLGIQYLIFCLLWLFMPDYPPESSKQINYLKLLWTIPKIVIHEPLLVQACLGGYLVCGPFASYWTTLTFLLSSPPYEYSSMVIGLFAFIGIAGLCFGPPFAHFIVDKFAPLFSVVVGELLCLCGVAIGTYTGSFTVAGPVIEAFAIDLGLQMTQIAQRKSIYSLDPSARNRINAAYMYSLTCGQIMGTTIGNKLYSEPDNGWVYSGSANMGFLALALLVCFARGPWEKRWIGWRGGWSPRQQSH